MGGTLLFNPETDASVFFPAAGRRWHQDGSLEFAGETGYYWSSSVAPGWTQKEPDGNGFKETGTPFGNIWSIELNYPLIAPKSMSAHFGYSIRCVRK
ncbi:MAG: fibrobacter succinogenes major paralogous domain-containing protein [Parabacteroides sp.]|nr:fibrobacter succinogenes major paralogous domain-containing protein [Parabacteroides sp.]